MKKLFLFLAAGVTLAACTQEVLPVPEHLAQELNLEEFLQTHGDIQYLPMTEEPGPASGPVEFSALHAHSAPE